MYLHAALNAVHEKHRGVDSSDGGSEGTPFNGWAMDNSFLQSLHIAPCTLVEEIGVDDPKVNPDGANTSMKGEGLDCQCKLDTVAGVIGVVYIGKQVLANTLSITVGIIECLACEGRTSREPRFHVALPST